MPDPRTTTVDDLNKFDIGCRVTFKRPASSEGRPVIVGKLMAVRQAPYARGNMPKQGYAITVQYAGRYDWSPNRDEFGPLPANLPITVGGLWIEKKTDLAAL